MITQKELKSYLRYEPETGLFFWAVNKGRFKAGDQAGSRESKSLRYMRIKINRKRYKAHRLAWLYVTGELPLCIDHINGDGLDNRWVNLRNVRHLDNSRNLKMNSKNTSGVMGVTFKKRDGKWQAKIKILGREKSLGYYKDFFEACCARKSAERRYGFHRNHGSIRSFN